MARADHVDGQVEGEHLVDLLQHLVAERREDVGVVLQRLLVQLLLVHLVVEAEAGGVVLAEGVVGHEDALARHVGEHAVGPVEHRGLDEDELAAPETDLVACFHDAEVPRRVVVAGDARLAPGRDDEGRLRTELHDGGQAARVIRLGMVGDDVVDLRRIHDLADVLENSSVNRPQTVSTRAIFSSTMR